MTPAYPTRQALDDLAARAQAGDGEAANAVAIAVHRFAHREAGRLSRNAGIPIDRADLYAEGMACLPDVLRYWRAERGPFLNYFCDCCRRAVWAAVTRELAAVRKLAGYAALCRGEAETMDDGPHGSRQKRYATRRAKTVARKRERAALCGISAQDTHLDLQASLESLSPELRQVVTMRYGLDGGVPLSIERLAEAVGVSRHTVRVWMAEALDELRTSFGVEILN